MSRLTPRLRWSRAIKSGEFPAQLRSIKGTLLSLVDVMTPTGELHEWREAMATAAGLPPRTLDRHLARAVEAGWLRHEDHGGRGRRALYVAAIPGDSAPLLAHYSAPEPPDSAPLTRWLSGGNSAPPGGALNKESANERERVAVDHQRRRRTDHDGSRDEREHDVTSQAGTDRSWLPTPVRRLPSDSTGDVA